MITKNKKEKKRKSWEKSRYDLFLKMFCLEIEITDSYRVWAKVGKKTVGTAGVKWNEYRLNG